MTQTFAEKIAKAQDFLPINGTDYIEFYVGNAKQAAHFYKTAFGFQSEAYAGPETGIRDRASYVLKQNKIRIILTTALKSDSPISEHVKKHGDGVKILALWVDDAEKSLQETVKRGAKVYQELEVKEDEFGEVRTAGIYTYGETVHMFVERKNYTGPFMPGYVKWESDYNPEETGLLYVDHCVGNVGWDRMNETVEWYQDVMGFVNILSFDDKQINTEYSALMSKVMSNGNGYVKFPINEPAEGKKKSQIEEYLEFYEGEGVQHAALATHDILKTVKALKERGVEFLGAPPEAYYDMLSERVGEIDEEIKAIQDLGILVDRDEEGYLLQIFTKPIEDRPTLFFEIIQRKGAQSFGAGNFKALFEAIEREQEKRGNL
ncbi:4-hydroxyphenylpyruvate dioxygenase [Sphingobacterium mizutaii NBRC 14946 = DSM 11724]|uniref:4-hydroxyphenylpyruvate dioxygenase n=2 Tax=Sphingobacterium mizutaii TaxID=1010 RepID=A0AAJ5C0Y3_9SPHI|nr:4-hydroxyphenylpyruvate dioxygenase [Sphingobacterium mizutaii]GEM70094.1 4-hydroxyphenylpyruvate dioxygenase [Sphingobacterium mizutaii NBRC 14946 = DSM 11724]SDL24538.1 4-hydroxyphenylpyruvate dioxygenase [Sphingobacterium mizutaii]SNV53037.1 4-hydroxyphenylpyruvate dioxygenase [Sphingobacterium mizutaii]